METVLEIWDDTIPRKRNVGKTGKPFISVSAAGRITVNKALSERLGLKNGSKISFFKNGSRRSIYVEIGSPTGIELKDKSGKTSELVCNHSVVATKLITALGLSEKQELEGKEAPKTLKLKVDFSLQTIADRQGFLVSNAEVEEL